MVRISDARMSGTAFGTVVLHVAPESAVGGPLLVVRDGDPIVLDVEARRLDLDLPGEEIARRLGADPATRSRSTRAGYGALFLQHVLQADQGLRLRSARVRRLGGSGRSRTGSSGAGSAAGKATAGVRCDRVPGVARAGHPIHHGQEGAVRFHHRLPGDGDADDVSNGQTNTQGRALGTRSRASADVRNPASDRAIGRSRLSTDLDRRRRVALRGVDEVRSDSVGDQSDVGSRERLDDRLVLGE